MGGGREEITGPPVIADIARDRKKQTLYARMNTDNTDRVIEAKPGTPG